MGLTTVNINYHLEVNHSDVGFHDRLVIQELIKTAVRTNQLDSPDKSEFMNTLYALTRHFHYRGGGITTDI
jgi:hypothetical protein